MTSTVWGIQWRLPPASASQALHEASGSGSWPPALDGTAWTHLLQAATSLHAVSCLPSAACSQFTCPAPIGIRPPAYIAATLRYAEVPAAAPAAPHSGWPVKAGTAAGTAGCKRTAKAKTAEQFLRQGIKRARTAAQKERVSDAKAAVVTTHAAAANGIHVEHDSDFARADQLAATMDLNNVAAAPASDAEQRPPQGRSAAGVSVLMDSSQLWGTLSSSDSDSDSGKDSLQQQVHPHMQAHVNPAAGSMQVAHVPRDHVEQVPGTSRSGAGLPDTTADLAAAAAALADRLLMGEVSHQATVLLPAAAAAAAAAGDTAAQQNTAADPAINHHQQQQQQQQHQRLQLQQHQQVQQEEDVTALHAAGPNMNPAEQQALTSKAAGFKRPSATPSRQQRVLSGPLAGYVTAGSQQQTEPRQPIMSREEMLLAQGQHALAAKQRQARELERQRLGFTTTPIARAHSRPSDAAPMSLIPTSPSKARTSRAQAESATATQHRATTAAGSVHTSQPTTATPAGAHTYKQGGEQAQGSMTEVLRAMGTKKTVLKALRHLNRSHDAPLQGGSSKPAADAAAMHGSAAAPAAVIDYGDLYDEEDEVAGAQGGGAAVNAQHAASHALRAVSDNSPFLQQKLQQQQQQLQLHSQQDMQQLQHQAQQDRQQQQQLQLHSQQGLQQQQKEHEQEFADTHQPVQLPAHDVQQAVRPEDHTKVHHTGRLETDTDQAHTDHPHTDHAHADHARTAADATDDDFDFEVEDVWNVELRVPRASQSGSGVSHSRDALGAPVRSGSIAPQHATQPTAALTATASQPLTQTGSGQPEAGLPVTAAGGMEAASQPAAAVVDSLAATDTSCMPPSRHLASAGAAETSVEALELHGMDTAATALPAATTTLPTATALPAATTTLPTATALPAATTTLPTATALPAATALHAASTLPAATGHQVAVEPTDAGHAMSVEEDEDAELMAMVAALAGPRPTQQTAPACDPTQPTQRIQAEDGAAHAGEAREKGDVAGGGAGSGVEDEDALSDGNLGLGMALGFTLGPRDNTVSVQSVAAFNRSAAVAEKVQPHHQLAMPQQQTGMPHQQIGMPHGMPEANNSNAPASEDEDIVLQSKAATGAKVGKGDHNSSGLQAGQVDNKQVDIRAKAALGSVSSGKQKGNSSQGSGNGKQGHKRILSLHEGQQLHSTPGGREVVEVGLYADLKVHMKETRKRRAKEAHRRPTYEVVEKPPCRHWALGLCDRPDCRFAHIGEPATTLIPCFDFAAGRPCPREARGQPCRWSHEPGLLPPCQEHIMTGRCPNPGACPKAHTFTPQQLEHLQYYYDFCDKKQKQRQAQLAGAQTWAMQPQSMMQGTHVSSGWPGLPAPAHTIAWPPGAGCAGQALPQLMQVTAGFLGGHHLACQQGHAQQGHAQQGHAQQGHAQQGHVQQQNAAAVTQPAAPLAETGAPSTSATDDWEVEEI